MAATSPSLELDSKGKAELEREDLIEDRSVEGVAAQTIEAFLDSRAFKREQIEAALAEAENGEFISSEAVSGWMTSWDTPNESPPPEPDVFPRRR